MKRILRLCVSVLMLMALLAVEAVPSLADTAPTSVKLDQSGTVTLAVGNTLTLNATLYPEGAQSTLTWKSTKKGVASVSGGVVTANKVGTTTVTVTTRNKKKAKVKVKVVDPYKPAKVSLNHTGTITLLATEGIQLTAALFPETAQSTLKWKTSNKRIAIVNQNGYVGALAPGKCTITVTTRNKKKAKVKIRVIDDGQRPITAPEGYNLPYIIYCCKNSHTIAIIAKDDSGNWTRVVRLYPTGMGRKNVTDVGFYTITKKERWHKWGSGYSPYANRLSVGIYLHGPIYKKKNHNTIRPSYYNCIGTNCSSGCIRTICGCAAWVYYNCPIGTHIIVAQNARFSTPRPPKIGKKAKRDPSDPGDNVEIFITGFAVSPGALTLDQGASQGLAPTSISPANANTKGITFASDNPGVATVSEAGVVTGVGPGTATIYVTAADDYKCTVRVPVTVNAVTPPTEAQEVESAQAEAQAAESAQAEAAGAVDAEAVTASEEGLSVEDALPAIEEAAFAEEAVDAQADSAAAGETAVEPDAAEALRDQVIPAAMEDAPEPEAAQEEPQVASGEDADNGLSFSAEAAPEETEEIIVAEE
ncbi:MAG: Ig-like domain-containing protein [Clostridia bacterium]|nr:Ig-like domain-containing protein [Clostridia bacterium]